jgi:uncharacterized protein (DUF488 family)
MIYTIGYQALTPGRLLGIVTHLDAILIDVRERPISRKPGFGFRQLEALFNTDCTKYVTAGHYLGGRGNVSKAGIERLRKFDSFDAPNCVLMCMEHHPADCHRHRNITGPHFKRAEHLLPIAGAVLGFNSDDLSDAIAGTAAFSSILSYSLEL